MLFVVIDEPNIWRRSKDTVYTPIKIDFSGVPVNYLDVDILSLTLVFSHPYKSIVTISDYKFSSLVNGLAHSAVFEAIVGSLHRRFGMI